MTVYTCAVAMQVTERSGLEQDLGCTVQLVKAKRSAEEGQAEAALYAKDPYGIKAVAPGQPLPPPPVRPQTTPPPVGVLQRYCGGQQEHFCGYCQSL